MFEGNVPADPSDNIELVATLENCSELTVAESKVWLGSAVRIEPPTQLTLRHQGGNHLLIVGHDEQMALGVLATSLISLVAQQSAAEAQFTVLDGTRPESAEQGTWQQISDALPNSVKLCNPRETTSVIEALANEVAQRSENSEQKFAPYYLIIHDLAQFATCEFRKMNSVFLR